MFNLGWSGEYLRALPSHFVLFTQIKRIDLMFYVAADIFGVIAQPNYKEASKDLYSAPPFLLGF